MGLSKKQKQKMNKLTKARLKKKERLAGSCEEEGGTTSISWSHHTKRPRIDTGSPSASTSSRSSFKLENVPAIDATEETKEYIRS